jgi:hypothetical protein
MLVELLEKDAVPFETLHARYGSLLELVRRLIGVVPNCDPYLEIWPTAFRTYNVMVPNLLNLPFLVWGLGAPRSPLGLALYVSSRTAGCPYCSAHTCSFALRRGATVEEVASALDGDRTLTVADRAAVRVARARREGAARLADTDSGARDLTQSGRGGPERARVLPGHPASGNRRAGDVRLGDADAAPALELLPGGGRGAPTERVMFLAAPPSSTVSGSPAAELD